MTARTRLFSLGLLVSLAAPPAGTAAPQAVPPVGTSATERARTERATFLDMFARAYSPGRSGQVMVVGREGEILTRRGAEVTFMHGSPWSYDTHIPLFRLEAIPPAPFVLTAEHLQALASGVA